MANFEPKTYKSIKQELYLKYLRRIKKIYTLKVILEIHTKTIFNMQELYLN